MKNVTLLMISLFLSLSLFAQYESIDLSKYKLPEIKRHQLDTYLDFNGNSDSWYYLYQNQEDTLDRSSSNMHFNGNLNYSFYRSSSKTQQNLTATFSFRQNNTKNDDWSNENQNSKYRNSKSSFYVHYDYKYFLNSNDFFYSIEPKIWVDYSSRHELIQNRIKENEWQNNNSLGLGMGYGRIERVEDFRHAVLIVQELEKRGVLSRNPDENEIYELAELISELKNERFFDSRNRREKDLSKINQYLTDNNFISQNNIKYFTGLSDMWSFGGLQERLSGNQIKLMLTPKSYYQKTDIGEETDFFKYNFSEFMTSILYTSFKPVSVRLQRDYKIEAFNNFSDFYNVVFEDSGNKSFDTGISGQFKIGFYPNTRTDFSLTGQYGIAYSSNDKVFKGGRVFNVIAISTEGYYYISERFRVGYQFAYLNNIADVFDRKIKNSYQRNCVFDVRMNYAIF